MPRLPHSKLKQLRHFAVAAVIFAALTFGPARSPGSAANTPSDLSAGTNASLPEGLLEAVREALGPQAAVALAGLRNRCGCCVPVGSATSAQVAPMYTFVTVCRPRIGGGLAQILGRQRLPKVYCSPGLRY